MTGRIFGLADFVDPQLGTRWNESRSRIGSLLSEVGVSEGTHTQSVHLYPILTGDPEQTIDELAAATAHEGLWSYLTTTRGPDGRLWIFALPTRNASPSNIWLLPYVEIHSRLIAWWLTYAWRSDELAKSAWDLGDSFRVLPAAACVRALTETAAAIWSDSVELRNAWQTIKRESTTSGPKWDHWRNLWTWIHRTAWGSKFDKRAQDLAETWGKFQRANVLSQIERLAKASNRSLQDDYQ